MSRKRPGEKLPPFVPTFRHTIKTAAWRKTSLGARATFFVLESNYNSKVQNAVFLSARMGEQELGVNKDTVCKYIHELEYYGFIIEVMAAHLGVVGTGKAARYRLTDRWYAGKPPTYDFQNWDGIPYDPKKHFPVRKTRTRRPKKPDIRVLGAEAENGNKFRKTRT
jgi:hypothetical protein